MLQTRQSLGGLGNLMFKQAYIMERMFDKQIPDVYLQSEKYFKKHAEEIKGFYRIGMSSQIDKVSIHIRRGDYLKADHFHVDLSKTDYYQQAIKLFPNEQFIVFCKDNQGSTQDLMDREWCKDFMNMLVKPNRWEFAPFEGSEVDDLNLMASCKSNIMANSSFSWWAAYLNPNPSKVVVCPKKWFVDGIQRTDLLDDWMKL